MALSIDQKNRISEIVKEILLSRIDEVPELSQVFNNVPFHSSIRDSLKNGLGFLKIELPYLVAIASWLHGLNTSLGSGFESLAHILSGGYKRKFTKSFTLKIKTSQSINIESLIRELKSGIRPNLKRENDLIFNFAESEGEVDSLELTIDNYLESDDLVEGIELKSVRPNSGEGRGEKQKILYAKAAFKKLHPKKEIKYFVGFPFDPTSTTPTGYDKERFFNYLIEFKKFFSPKEVLLSGELWNHLSGEKNTMEEVLEIITKTVEKVAKT